MDGIRKFVSTWSTFLVTSKKFKKFVKGGYYEFIKGKKHAYKISGTFLTITYYRHVWYEPILIKQVAFDEWREWTGYSQMFVTFENSKIIGGYRSLNMGVQAQIFQNKSLFATAKFRGQTDANDFLESKWQWNALETVTNSISYP